MPNNLFVICHQCLNSQGIQAKENERVMQFEPFFNVKMCAGLDQCQGTVHELIMETDDILLKASIDPSSACLGSVSEGMGKGHIRVDFFTTCPCVKAHKRTGRWRGRTDLWFSLPGPHWPLCRAAAEFSISPDVQRGTWPLVTDVAQGVGGQRQRNIKPPVWVRCKLQGSNCSFSVEARCRRLRDLPPLAVFQGMHKELLSE